MYIFSGSYSGQNRNHIFRCLAVLAANGRCNRILQYFPVRGHTLLSYYRDCGLIKNILQRILLAWYESRCENFDIGGVGFCVIS
jgi:hypothetical protein